MNSPIFQFLKVLKHLMKKTLLYCFKNLMKYRCVVDSIQFLIVFDHALAMPRLLVVAKSAVRKGLAQGHGASYLKELSDYIISSLIEVLNKVKVMLPASFQFW